MNDLHQIAKDGQGWEIVGETEQQTPAPIQQLLEDNKVSQVKCGYWHTVALSGTMRKKLRDEILGMFTHLEMVIDGNWEWETIGTIG